MYSELSEQFLHTKEDFKNTKSKDYLTATCPKCFKEFLITKHQLQTKWRRNVEKIIYCSHPCSIKQTNKEKVDCLYCNKPFIRLLNSEQRAKKFCSKTCSALHLNSNKTREEQLKINLKLSIKYKERIMGKYLLLTVSPNLVYTITYNMSNIISTRKVNKLKCQVCDKEFFSFIKTTKLCSKLCFKQRLRNMHKEKPHLILNRSNPESYLEKSFREFIESNGFIKNVNYKQEHNFTLSTGKRYIADFYFPELNSIIELDGSQHKNMITEDSVRDALILSEFNVKTIRITHKEWVKKTKVNTINTLLSIS